MLNYIDLFSGAGGLSLGFDRAGFKNIFSVDIDPVFNLTYRRNFPKHVLIETDISKLSSNEILKLVGNKTVDVIAGGPPCQGFSMAGNIGRKFIDDPRNHLFQEFARIVNVVKPKFFVMENVARLYTHNSGKTRQEIIDKFNEMGYRVEVKVLNTAEHGVPQKRRRVIFIGTNTDAPIIFPSEDKSKPKSIKDAIGNLPELKSGESSSIPNHVAMNHTEQMLKKMSYVKDGGNRLDIPEELRPKSGDARKYMRYHSAEPSVCVTGDMRKVFHYSQNRALTVRELARIQTFPDNFIFEGSVIAQQQQVGNSVPPELGFRLAESLVAMYRGHYDA